MTTTIRRNEYSGLLAFFKIAVLGLDDLARLISPDQDYGRPLNESYKSKL